MIEFENVSFAYAGEEPCIRGVNLKAAEGECVVFKMCIRDSSGAARAHGCDRPGDAGFHLLERPAYKARQRPPCEVRSCRGA